VFGNIYSMYLHLLFSRFSRKWITEHWPGYIGWRGVPLQQPYTRVDYTPQSGTKNLASVDNKLFILYGLASVGSYLNSGKISLFYKQSWNSTVLVGVILTPLLPSLWINYPIGVQ
jgi:hypothetical protein